MCASYRFCNDIMLSNTKKGKRIENFEWLFSMLPLRYLYSTANSAKNLFKCVLRSSSRFGDDWRSLVHCFLFVFFLSSIQTTKDVESIKWVTFCYCTLLFRSKNSVFDIVRWTCGAIVHRALYSMPVGMCCAAVNMCWRAWVNIFFVVSLQCFTHLSRIDLFRRW